MEDGECGALLYVLTIEQRVARGFAQHRKDVLRSWQHWLWHEAPLDERREIINEIHRVQFAARYTVQNGIERERSTVRKHADTAYAARHAKPWDKRRELAHAQSDGTLTLAVVAALFDHASVCPYCGATMTAGDRSLDHCEPLSLGGPHSISNVLVCCVPCNRAKSQLTWHDWLASLSPVRRAHAERARHGATMAGVLRRHSRCGSRTSAGPTQL
jgi:5-methylcytosine-specific restriction endonuclease McrA